MGIKRKIISVALCLIMMLSCINVNVIDANAQDTITIDVTGLASGSESSHDCNKYLTNKYDDTYHWKECTVCGKIIGEKTKHNINTYYTNGDSCSKYNKKVLSCSCGYYKETDNDIPHKGTFFLNANNFIHVMYCHACMEGIEEEEPHYDASGNKLGCRTGRAGLCAKCGNYITPTHQVGPTYKYKEKRWYDGSDVCGGCGKEIMNVNKSTLSVTFTSYHHFVATMKIYPANGATITSIRKSAGFHNTSIGTAHQTNAQIVGDHAEITVEGDFKTNTLEQSVRFGNVDGTLSDGSSFDLIMWGDIPSSLDAPNITDIKQIDNNTVGEWCTSKTIIISGTENEYNTVEVSVIDDLGNIIQNNIKLGVNNKKWFYSFNLVTEANKARTYKIIVKDEENQESTKTFAINKMDAKPPTPISQTLTSTEWSKSKIFTAQATDTGIGGVEISFNNTDSYIKAEQESTIYSKTFLLTGDVYGTTKAAVYYKDALGNETTQFITISNIDNTAPTITNTKITYDKIVTIEVTANDNKDFGGDVGIKEGSGIAGYALSESTTAPDTFQESNVLEIPKTGDYYLYVKDNVGNVQSKHIGTIKTECEINTSYTGIGSISNSSKVDYTENTSVFIVPAEGFDLATLKIDGVTVTPVRKYDFISVEKDHKVEATFSITQNKKMELIQKGYSWIDLKL